MAQRLGRYELLARLGHGGMGEVFLARAPGSPGPVVLKRLLPHLRGDEALGRRFLHEAGVAARLVHPNIARVLELGEADGEFSFTMEFIEGCDLTALGPVPLPAALRIVADAARALEAAHTARDEAGRLLGVVHCDVSPKNLLVGVDGVTRLIDFGLARLEREEDSLGGTWEYMAPEQALDGTTDARTDQFSLGVVLWELLTGRRLFAGDTDATTLDQVVACRVPRAAEVNPRVPAGLDAVVMRLLAREPGARFPGCGVVADALERALVEARADDVRAQVGRLAASRQRREAVTEPAQTPSPPPPPTPTVRAPLSDVERRALARLAALPQPLTLEVLEAALHLGDGAPPALDVAQALVDRGALAREGEDAFRVVPDGEG